MYNANRDHKGTLTRMEQKFFEEKVIEYLYTSHEHMKCLTSDKHQTLLVFIEIGVQECLQMNYY